MSEGGGQNEGFRVMDGPQIVVDDQEDRSFAERRGEP